MGVHRSQEDLDAPLRPGSHWRVLCHEMTWPGLKSLKPPLCPVGNRLESVRQNKGDFPEVVSVPREAAECFTEKARNDQTQICLDSGRH